MSLVCLVKIYKENKKEKANGSVPFFKILLLYLSFYLFSSSNHFLTYPYPLSFPLVVAERQCVSPLTVCNRDYKRSHPSPTYPILPRFRFRFFWDRRPVNISLSPQQQQQQQQHSQLKPKSPLFSSFEREAVRT